MRRTRVKICCIRSIAEARLAVKFGADAIGLVGRMPSGPGPIDDESITAIAAAVPPPVATFLLTSETSADDIIAHWRRTRTGTIQIVDYIELSDYDVIRAEIPGVKLVQVVHVTDDEAVGRALRASRYADALLLDSGNPEATTKILGGTGKVHDWHVSREIVRSVKVPVFLAGGINHENVASAIDSVHPYGIDLCTGVRTDGKLDPGKLEALMNEMNQTSAG